MIQKIKFCALWLFLKFPFLLLAQHSFTPIQITEASTDESILKHHLSTHFKDPIAFSDIENLTRSTIDGTEFITGRFANHLPAVVHKSFAVFLHGDFSHFMSINQPVVIRQDSVAGVMAGGTFEFRGKGYFHLYLIMN